MLSFSIPDAAIGPVAAAVVAAVVAFLGLVISKESKISEFRQAWIDELRSDLASIITNATLIRGAVSVTYASRKEGLEAIYEFAHDFNRSMCSVRLRLNPSEKRCIDVLNTIADIDRLITQNPIDLPVAREKEQLLLTQSQKLLKFEWSRVRRGEPVFVASKWIFAVSSVALAAALVYTWWTPPAVASPKESIRTPADSAKVTPPTPAQK